MFCAGLTWILIFYANFVVLKVILLPFINTTYSLIHTLFFVSVTVLAVSSHLRTMLSDPGAVPRGNATKEYIQQMGYKEGQVIFKCPKCCSIKPERAHHCSVDRQNLHWSHTLIPFLFVRFVRDASGKWITIALGSIIVLVKEIKSILFFSR